MALREFTATTGQRWQVWDTVPSTPHESELFAHNARLLAEAAQRDDPSAAAASADASRRVAPGREAGWLTFQVGDEKRRLSPIPPDWATASEATLQEWWQRADPVHLSAAAARLLGQIPR